jgi:hypothetical protein
MSAVDTLAAAIAEDLASGYYRTKFLPQNKILGPLVDGYLRGTGRRPTDAELGGNLYATARVLTEDARRSLVTAKVVYPSSQLVPSEVMP